MTRPQLFHCLRYTDADRGIAFLETLGFAAAMVVRDPDDQAVVAHAQLNWRENGGIMLGSLRGEDDPPYHRGVCNLVVPTDERVDELVELAEGAGAVVASAPEDAPHGGRNACVMDFDGHLWNIDSYPGV